MTPAITLTKAMLDPQLFGSVYGASSFWTWRTLAKVIDGIPLTERREQELFADCTGRTTATSKPARTIVLLGGRRTGKDRFLSGVAVWRAALCCDWRQYLSPGEIAVVLLIGADRKQAAILRRYCAGLLQAPLLAREVTRNTDDVVEFRNHSSLEIVTNDARLIRGRTAIAVLGSEACFWKTEEFSSSNDEEVVSAATPSMAACPDGGLLIMASSVYRRRGWMFRRYQDLHGNDGTDDLCWAAPSMTMNPLLSTAIIDKAMGEDPQRAGAEFWNRWREDLADFCPLETIEACTDVGKLERLPQPDLAYVAHADAAGGTGSDSYGLAIGHSDEDGNAILDCLRERRPRFTPSDVVKEYADLVKSYGCDSVQGDAYAGGFHADEWLRNGITFRPCEHSTSEIYLHLLPLLLAGRVRLIDNARLRQQLASLERHTAPGGREQVRHPQVASAHDDIACAAAGVLVACSKGGAYDNLSRWVGMPDVDANLEWQRMRNVMYLMSGGLYR